MLIFDVAYTVALVETATAVIAIFGYADITAANSASAKIPFMIPVPKIYGIFLAYNSGVEWRVNVGYVTLPYNLRWIS